MRRNLTGKTFIITGAAGGLGRALCLALGQRGAKIVGFDADVKAIQETSASLARERIEHRIEVLDITNAKAVRRALKPLTKEGVDGVILNAGITRIAPFSETPFEEFVRVIEVNVFGAVIFARELLTALRDRKGALVGISSVSGFAPLQNRTAYSASKHALSGFLETLRSEESALDITVVYPSFLESAIRSRSVDGREVKKNKGVLATQDAAERIVKAIICRKKRLYMPFQSRLAKLLWNFAPGFYMRLMKRRA